jgi:galactokinase
VVARRARHVIDENRRVLDVIDAFDTGDLPAVGRAFAASQASLRDLYEVSCPELDALVDIATSVDGVIAARMTGAGFGGCTVNLVRPEAIDWLRAAVERDYPSRTGRTAIVMPVEIADGAGWLAR